MRSLILLGCYLCAVSVVGQKSCQQSTPYMCANGERCYSALERCDGVFHCQDGSDETNNCTNQLKPVARRHDENLAWLITPILFLLGVAYAIYKCIKDGVCGAIKRRIVICIRGDVPRASDFHPLHQVSFSTSTQIPCTYTDIHGNPIVATSGMQSEGNDPHQMMVVRHDQHFSFMFRDGRMVRTGVHNPRTPPSYEQSLQAPAGTIMMQQSGMVVAPSYKDASTLPSYMEAIGATSDARRGNGVADIDEGEEDEEDDNNDGASCDERASLMRPSVLSDRNTRGGTKSGRRRHHSQWNGGSSNSGSGGSSFRRRHHSQP